MATNEDPVARFVQQILPVPRLADCTAHIYSKSAFLCTYMGNRKLSLDKGQAADRMQYQIPRLYWHTLVSLHTSNNILSLMRML